MEDEMSRSGYTDECDGWALIRWRGAVNSALRGKRGQAALREILEALDALPEKKLAKDSLVNAEGEYCTLGALGLHRGIDVSNIDPDDREAVANSFGISEAMAAEIMYINDEWHDMDWMTIEVEVCGPMRPHYPDYGKHKKMVTVPNSNAGYQRWLGMREWVQSQLKNNEAAA